MHNNNNNNDYDNKSITLKTVCRRIIDNSKTNLVVSKRWREVLTDADRPVARLRPRLCISTLNSNVGPSIAGKPVASATAHQKTTTVVRV